MINRLDKELYRRNLAKSRTTAAELITNNAVTVNGSLCNKVSQAVNEDDIIEISDKVIDTLRYVSRAGLKLEQAVLHYNLDLNGKICLDIGASTGGFTDCMLKYGARRVFAVDVGTSQLADSLRRDPRVVSVEQCDIREFIAPVKAEFIAVDVSFISVKLILPKLKELADNGADAVVLVKPQFELGRRHKGVITESKVRNKIVDEVATFAKSSGLLVKGLCESSVVGKSGNREYLMWLGID
ncbi:MAG: TlyA family RNA methyltransferase [Oscillospiraceae bacterium]|nr:TlyA family RNA methyltransferase [Oscillospiraceae bacterium]